MQKTTATVRGGPTTRQKNQRPEPIVIAAPGCSHPLANQIDALDPSLIRGAPCVLISGEAALADCVMRLTLAGAIRVTPVNPSSADVSGDIERALQTLRASLGGNRTPSAALLRAARACTVEMNPAILGDFAPIAQSLARLGGGPVEFVAGTALAMAAGILGGRYKVRVRDGFEVPLIAWIGLVGDASAGKSPVMDLMVRPLRALERESAERFDPSTAPAGTQPARALIANASIEATLHTAAAQGRSLLKYEDELSAFFSDVGRYNKSSQGDLGLWLSAHNGYPITVDRRSLKAPLRVDHWGVSIVGGIPPAVLSDLARDGEVSDGSGLDVRFWWLYPQLPPVQLRPAQDDSGALAKWSTIVSRLFAQRLQAAPDTVIDFTADAREKFELWRFDLLNDARKGSTDVDAWTGKLPGTVARLAGILCTLDAALSNATPREITLDHVKRAAMLADLLTAHRRRVELGRGQPTLERLTSELAGFVVAHSIKTLDTFEARRGLVAGIRSEKTLRAVLLEMQSAGWLATYVSPSPSEILPPTIEIRPEVAALARTVQ